MLVARLSSLLSSIGKLVRRRGREGGGGALRQLCWAGTNIRISHAKWLK